MSDQLEELLDAVVDSTSFLTFVHALRTDRMKEVEAQQSVGIDLCGRGPNEWENHSIEDFLAAGAAWAEASDFGGTQGVSETNLWGKFAIFLYCGKIYE